MTELLQYEFMRRALLAAVLVGFLTPIVGTFLVQRRLALLGDGIGHVALTGVALGLMTGASPVLTAAVVATLGAILMEVVRVRTRASGEVALALLFYGGIAGGVLLIGLTPGASNATLTAYLFGSVSTVEEQDIWVVAVLAAAVVVVVGLFGRQLFVLCQDEDVARAHGLPVRFLSILLAVTAALTVVIAMRVVGLLMVSALMIVPVAAAQQLTRSFRVTMGLAVAIGLGSSVSGLSAAFYSELAPGATIVLIALAVFCVAVTVGGLIRRRGRRGPGGPRRPEGPFKADTMPQTARGG
ncbi:zinc transport system permease protein [Nocardiopsis sp. Huas11]|uniref:metal ABC transporter permease n=1 Tax=Nocardiopsis sp. Huas11 TaxID=2183912 RepID=UPI000EB57F31|nr:metal ABC transporter permease [Nocardiopsis sp. Huas11]RKS10088.1 zinc transport system permease protein [Nocardiopsis sp. Huas11]